MLSTNTESIFRDMQRVADKIKLDVESQLHEAFRTFEVIENLTPENLPRDEKAFYRMMIKTDDNGHVKVKTIEKEPGKPEKVEVQEYDKGTKSLEQGGQQQKPGMISGGTEEKGKEKGKEKGSQVSKTGGEGEPKQVSESAEFEKSFDSIQNMADRIRQDVESRLGRTFGIWNLMDYSFPIDPEKSYVRMKIKTDDNGHVRVKTAEKEPGKSWDVKIEEYDKGDKSKAVEQGGAQGRSAIGQSTETMQGEKKSMQSETAHQA